MYKIPIQDSEEGRVSHTSYNAQTTENYSGGGFFCGLAGKGDSVFLSFFYHPSFICTYSHLTERRGEAGSGDLAF